MLVVRRSLLMAGLLASAIAQAAQPVPGDHTHQRLKQAPMPTVRQSLPPTPEQQKYQLPETKKPRNDLLPKNANAKSSARAALATPECKNMDTMATYNGSALADYIVNLPDHECTYPMFSLTAEQASKIYSPSNFSAIASRFTQEAGSYNATNRALVNLAISLRAAYYVANAGTMPLPSAAVTTSLRAPIKTLMDGSILYATNPVADSTAGETVRLVTNMHDEAYFLPTVKNLIQRFTNSAGNPNAAEPLKQSTASAAVTSATVIVYYAHYRPEALSLLQNEASYPTVLNNFVVQNKAALIGTSSNYLLTDTANEAFRFMQYAGLKNTVKPMVQAMLNTSTMTGADSGLWLAGASAVKYYDNANCASYGTCNYETQLANAVLKNSYTCSPTLRIRAQDMTTAQMQDSCAKLQAEEGYFHNMMQTRSIPVANDNNTSLELVVFDDYTNYAKYASVIYDMDTNNGGMYLEGDPAVPGNQARFIAHEASWLRPNFIVWNLEHEYVHYLDGRFDMKGDFEDGVAKPTVWWIEGIAEYLSLKNNNQQSIDMARTGTYKLSQIFGNTYSMSDYTNRAYRWGYMATRFMMERHRSDVDAVVAKFRVGDYDGYQNYMAYIGTRYDGEFSAWAATATTAGEPPMPAPALPPCSSSSQLGKNCAISGWASGSQAYSYIMLPAGAKNLKLFTSGGTGDVDLYVAVDRYPTTTSFDVASTNVGNSESVSIASPLSGRWYYIVLKAKQGFSGVTLGATYE
jgi:microbial collagenase